MSIFSVDEWLIERYEHVAHRAQMFTGKTNFWMAGACYLACGLICALSVVLFVYGVQPAWAMRLGIYASAGSHRVWIDFAVASLWARRGLFGWKREESRAFARLADGVSNPRRIHAPDKILRLFFVCFYGSIFVVGLFVEPRFYTFGVLFVSALYLEACDPLPPCAGKIREWLSAWSRCSAQETAA